MSSTNRGSERAADDFYETPAWCVRAILPHLPRLPGLRILEPSAGRGAIVTALLDAGAERSRVVAVEKDKDRALLGPVPTMAGDFLLAATAVKYDLVVMNPPFSAAQEHVTHAISMLAPGGQVAALLRLAFCTSAKRAPFRKAHPFDLYPLASRPSFTPDGKTDSADYAWFVFHGVLGPGMRPDGGRFAVLEGKGS